MTNHPASQPHEEAMIEAFREDPRRAVEYIDAYLEDGSQEEVLRALQLVSQAFGGVEKLAEVAELNPTFLDLALSPQGNPELRSLTALLKAMGMRLAVQPITAPH